MNPTDILKWATLGSQLVTTLGIPVAKVITLYRSEGVTDEQLKDLEMMWTALSTQIEDRISELKNS